MSIDDREIPRRRHDDPLGPPLEEVAETWWEWIKNYTVRKEECTVIWRGVVTTALGAALIGIWNAYVSVRDTPEQHAQIRKSQIEQQSAIELLKDTEKGDDLRLSDMERRMRRLEDWRDYMSTRYSVPGGVQ